ncbi:ATP-binding protein [Anaerotignum sp.]|uniref:ATP-binding protein n=1 Tax=Anaerotignum sp. TaxID=2039241 RepID=UPI002714A095|nr:4Fe-4S binding protein [Anaerotignum sp.]
MKKLVKINLNKCPQNHRCPSVWVCPVGALTQENKFSAPKIHEDLCIGCGKCARVCPKKALYMDEGV